MKHFLYLILLLTLNSKCSDKPKPPLKRSSGSINLLQTTPSTAPSTLTDQLTSTMQHPILPLSTEQN